ncbi:hypothetical protein QVD17_30413 [Tagetes erecta]|uniref:Uncharacterized protein n=1 Tax=Tagetes erecta TaxID=13708 RepID=A0AAD8NM78_TARER|nr:hypothetical protein QVD17_30413 [Tagetes erecta]
MVVLVSLSTVGGCGSDYNGVFVGLLWCGGDVGLLRWCRVVVAGWSIGGGLWCSSSRISSGSNGVGEQKQQELVIGGLW